ncbi:MAG: hypothetical protein AAFQ66_02210, partial [Pseudomonadota bacterium]
MSDEIPIGFVKRRRAGAPFDLSVPRDAMPPAEIFLPIRKQIERLTKYLEHKASANALKSMIALDDTCFSSLQPDH